MTYARISADGIAVLDGSSISSTYTHSVNGEDVTEPVQFSYASMLLLTDAQRAVHGIYAVVDDAIPDGQRVVSQSFEAGDGVIHRRYVLDAIPAPTAAELLAYAANARWQKEVGGTAAPGGGTIATDDRSKMLIFAARTKAKEDATTTKQWKLGPGQWVTLDAATLISIGDAVEAHVTACFDKEAEISAAIEAGTTTTFAAIDSAFEAVA